MDWGILPSLVAFPICSKSPNCTCSFGVDDHLHLAEFEYGCSWFRFYLGQCAAQSEWSSKIQSSLEARRQSSMIILVISLSYECQSKQIHHSKYNFCVIFILPIRKNISHSHIGQVENKNPEKQVILFIVATIFNV